MLAFVIAIEGNEQSQKAADRCIASGERNGVSVEKFCATTPNDEPYKILKKEGLSAFGFAEKYSRMDNCVSAFLSHYNLWKKSVDLNEPIAIFEHDAIIMDKLPKPPALVGSIGQPSYGKFNTPNKLGWGRLVSKEYFPGAHAYIVHPQGAKKLVERAKIDACPTDVFLHNSRFMFLEEYYPWIARADDSFTTIQNVRGCQAKHNFGDNYEVIDA